MDVNELADLLVDQGKTVSVAEACTCGLVGYMLSTVPGSSRYFPGGVIAYTGGLKQKILGVSDELYETKGSVSSEMAIAMAKGARDVTGTDFTISTTGVTGPSGGRSGLPHRQLLRGPGGPRRLGGGGAGPHRRRRARRQQTAGCAGRHRSAGTPPHPFIGEQALAGAGESYNPARHAATTTSGESHGFH